MPATRRSYGEGSLYWNESRQRWVGLVSLGCWPNGKRRVKWNSGRTKPEARTKLREAQRTHDVGLVTGPHAYTVREAVESWLELGMSGAVPVLSRTGRAWLVRTFYPSLVPGGSMSSRRGKWSGGWRSVPST
jgi:hypothetical protein